MSLSGSCGRGDALRRAAGLADLGGVRVAGEDLARPAADEAVAGDVFAALDGLEQVGRAGGLELGVGRDGRLEVGHEVGINGHDVALRAQAQKGFLGRLDVHAGGQRLCARRRRGQGE